MSINKYSTNQREQILKYLMENKEKHITVDDVELNFKATKNQVGKATIYRYFDMLVRDGKLRKYSGVNGKSACYQYTEQIDMCHEHYHLICDGCQELFHIECDYLKKANIEIEKKYNFSIDNLKTTFHGLCRKCYSKGI
jgi:Fur family ferric uptake transcriptional regulator